MQPIHYIHFKTVDSTNNWAKVHAHELSPDQLTLITAEEQTAGRGRFTRSWLSLKGNFLGTFVFFLKNLENLGNIPQVLSLSAIKTLQPFPIQIKWPNDLVFNQKKLGGILCEMVQIESQWAVIAGIGINLNMSLSNLATIDRPAASLLNETGQEYDLSHFTQNFAHQFHSDLQIFLKQGFAPFLTSYRQHLTHNKGDHLKFHNFQNILKGTFQEINSDGSLNLKLPDGTIKTCISGELV